MVLIVRKYNLLKCSIYLNIYHSFRLQGIVTVQCYRLPGTLADNKNEQTHASCPSKRRLGETPAAIDPPWHGVCAHRTGRRTHRGGERANERTDGRTTELLPHYRAHSQIRAHHLLNNYNCFIPGGGRSSAYFSNQFNRV